MGVWTDAIPSGGEREWMGISLVLNRPQLWSAPFRVIGKAQPESVVSTRNQEWKREEIGQGRLWLVATRMGGSHKKPGAQGAKNSRRVMGGKIFLLHSESRAHIILFAVAMGKKEFYRHAIHPVSPPFRSIGSGNHRPNRFLWRQTTFRWRSGTRRRV